ncbi:hypothetical protein EN780_02105 [Mesorhizobium sp. M4B.F.Ca.ET.089.01.1.1]|uniref:hypothetical protein n=1 Tax=Mesorhizobium sp. M4B.F.Ca.ET.089.01.1.1 TaxID=2496662 RepID=UPI000FE2F5E4|nr:hypothetical protein [Mesorhizobium sp. M4B.F.Ca.ET.089.01.1.1]RWX70812.1 hypothetical protein EN780_02105 [Mesorhizobium sp. M4B.F.Ca.ET.089.01.1.1]
MDSDSNETVVRQLSEGAPSNYMRARHPDLFSDTTVSAVHSVSKEVLSYHLETLTNQKDEATFEEFARRLCEKFISPNLRPQTGPVGGGDGKTDSETYPVSSAISERWFIPDRAGADQRWAFAFSAAADWKKKIRKDVKSIAETGRGYPRIYFVTNQFVPSKDSASMQDALEERYGIPVTILDKTWILNKVFEGHSLDIVVETLGVGREKTEEANRVGPRDSQRIAELEELEARIGDGSKYNGNLSNLVDDCIRAGVLSRGLERPRYEVEGKLDRALRLARKHGSAKQQLAAVYNWAWTAFFWFDDPTKTSELYAEVETLALSSDDSDDLERLTNILPLLHFSVTQELLTPDTAQLDQRLVRAREALARVINLEARPNNSLHARSLALMLEIVEAGKKGPDALIDIWKRFKLVLKDADGLGAFPFESIADGLTELGKHIPESPEFDELYEQVTDLLASRRSEGEAGKKNSQRAFQKLEKGLHFDAIRWFGRAVGLLVKEEYRDELSEVLFGSSLAFEEAGLYWAARNYAFAAVSQDLAEFTRTGNISVVNPTHLKRLFHMECRLGRTLYAIQSHELAMLVRGAQAHDEKSRQHYEEARLFDSRMFGGLLLRLVDSDLAEIRSLPDALERLAMPEARLVALFRLGQDQVAREEGWWPDTESAANIEDTFNRWYAYFGNDFFVRNISLYSGATVELTSAVVGCQIIIEAANNLVSLAVSEALLGGIEALLATSLEHRLLPHLERIRFRVDPVTTSGNAPILTFEDRMGIPVGVIQHPAHFELTTKADVLAFVEWLKTAAVEVIIRIAIPDDVEGWSKQVFAEENALDRALTFSNIPLITGSFFGDMDHLSLECWVASTDRSYDAIRAEPWVPSEIIDPESGVSVSEEPMDGFPFDTKRMKHTDMKIVSPIVVSKWNDARWRATLFMYSPDKDAPPPVLGIAFENAEAGKAIFDGFRERFGEHDPDNDLRIAVIRGVSSKNPFAYAVVVGPNVEKNLPESDKLVGFVSRINVMQPKNDIHLRNFIRQLKRDGRYLLAPAHLPSLDAEPKPMLGLGIGKYHLEIKEAWQIGASDPDAVVLDLDDPPIIPPDQPDAPVIETLRKKAEQQKGRDRKA